MDDSIVKVTIFVTIPKFLYFLTIVIFNHVVPQFPRLILKFEKTGGPFNSNFLYWYWFHPVFIDTSSVLFYSIAGFAVLVFYSGLVNLAD